MLLLFLRWYVGETSWIQTLESESMVEGWNKRDAGVVGFLVGANGIAEIFKGKICQTAFISVVV